MAELTVDQIGVRFGGVQALLDVDLRVPAGAVTGLIGPNGAGKTTLFNVITGLQTPTHGQVRLDGRDITGLKAHRRSRLGIGRTFQRLEMIGSLSARENVQLAAEAQPHKLPAGTSPAAFAAELLQRVGVAAVADEPADALPTGLARLVEVARALAASPSVLLLDEPSSGLDLAETTALGEVIRALADDGMAVLLVEHDMGLVMGTCDQVVVLDYGEVIARGEPAAVREDPAVVVAYLGAPAAEGARPRTGNTADAGPPDAAATGTATSGTPTSGTPTSGTPTSGTPTSGTPTSGTPTSGTPTSGTGTTGTAGPAALALGAVRAGYGRIEVLHGVSLELDEGSVCALLGPNGAGKSTLLKVVSGRLPATEGTVSVFGDVLRRPRPARLARQGVCSIPEGRAVFPNLTVRENLLMHSYRGRRFDGRRLEEQAFERFPRLSLRHRQLAGTLSGGEQQMLALARALFTEPRLLLLDEISMGLAPLVVEELYDTVAQLVAREKLTVLVVEQFAQMALSIATQAAVLVHGEIVQAGTPAEVGAYVADAYLGA